MRENRPAMNQRVYIDESKARNYLMAAAVIVPTDARELRKAVRGLLLARQSGLHMKTERDSRRRKILSTFVDCGVTATIYDAGGSDRPQLTRRAACLDAIVVDAQSGGHGHLILDRDDTLIHADRISIIAATQRIGYHELTYEHQKSKHDLLLAIPDAVAWAWAKGGDWRRRAELIVVEVKNV